MPEAAPREPTIAQLLKSLYVIKEDNLDTRVFYDTLRELTGRALDGSNEDFLLIVAGLDKAANDTEMTRPYDKAKDIIKPQITHIVTS